jgi:hypothetical protein
MAAPGVHVDGLVELVRALKGPAFRNVNAELREFAPAIAEQVVPHVRLAVLLSPAPQARAMADTIRVKRDRVPVVVIGKVNPKFRSGRFTRPGSDSKKRRGSIAHGIIYGPKGGKRNTKTDENYYRIPRDDTGGALGRTLKDGPAVRAASQAYLDGFMRIMDRHGFVRGRGGVWWRGAR